MTSLMFSEAAEAAQVVRRQAAVHHDALTRLVEDLRANPPSCVVVCARGSSDHAGVYGKYLIETLCGVPVAAAAPSVASVYGAVPAAGVGANVLCLAISQSGRSPDLLASALAWRDRGARLVALVNDETSPLALAADVLLPLSAGPEKSVAATKSFIAALSAQAALVAAWSEDAALTQALTTLPAQLEAAFELDWSDALPVLDGDRSLFVLGRGYGLGVAREAALKLKETCALHAEAFSSAEVRHGPMAIVRDGFPVLAFAGSDAGGDDVAAACAEFAERGAAVALAIAETSETPPAVLRLPALTAHPAIQPILQIQSFYRFAETLARRRGLDPDRPAFLKKVTETR
ncbi:SIS domain-containing protein [Brevundimonas sp.]|uniref:SIS domain-containing protein n=1 Tax=Brevundimonas sp. TaxID=1871086 RepID=UPI0034503CC3